MDELQAIESWAGALLARLSPAARRAVMRDIAHVLRRSQQARIAAQRNADGTAYAPRKARAINGAKLLRDKRGRLKRAAMFKKLRTARHLRIEADASGLAIGFASRVARIARVHQFGESACVAPDGPIYRYPVRQLLGLTTAEREMIRDRLLAYLAVK